jgi:DNA-binding GntR family transcriptional regulator
MAPMGHAPPTLVPLRRDSTLQAQAYAQLREALMNGRFLPGQAITVRAAAAALGTSPMPVRGALQLLEAEGALVARDQRRTLMIPSLSRAELAELRDIRVLLEGHAAARAAEHVTPTELKQAGAHLAAMRRAASAGDVGGYTLANWSFHSTIYRASRMKRLLAAVESLWLRIGPYVARMLPTRASLMRSLPNHERALAALRRRDRAAARRAIVADITDCAAELDRHLIEPRPAKPVRSSRHADLPQGVPA